MRNRRMEDLRVGVHTCNTEQKCFSLKKMEELKLKVFREKQSRDFKCMNFAKMEVIFLLKYLMQNNSIFIIVLYRCLKCLEMIPKALTYR